MIHFRYFLLFAFCISQGFSIFSTDGSPDSELIKLGKNFSSVGYFINADGQNSGSGFLVKTGIKELEGRVVLTAAHLKINPFKVGHLQFVTEDGEAHKGEFFAHEEYTYDNTKKHQSLCNFFAEDIGIFLLESRVSHIPLMPLDFSKSSSDIIEARYVLFCGYGFHKKNGALVQDYQRRACYSHISHCLNYKHPSHIPQNPSRHSHQETASSSSKPNHSKRLSLMGSESLLSPSGQSSSGDSGGLVLLSGQNAAVGIVVGDAEKLSTYSNSIITVDDYGASDYGVTYAPMNQSIHSRGSMFINLHPYKDWFFKMCYKLKKVLNQTESKQLKTSTRMAPTFNLHSYSLAYNRQSFHNPTFFLPDNTALSKPFLIFHFSLQNTLKAMERHKNLILARISPSLYERFNYAKRLMQDSVNFVRVEGATIYYHMVRDPMAPIRLRNEAFYHLFYDHDPNIRLLASLSSQKLLVTPPTHCEDFYFHTDVALYLYNWSSDYGLVQAGIKEYLQLCWYDFRPSGWMTSKQTQSDTNHVRAFQNGLVKLLMTSNSTKRNLAFHEISYYLAKTIKSESLRKSLFDFAYNKYRESIDLYS